LFRELPTKADTQNFISGEKQMIEKGVEIAPAKGKLGVSHRFAL